MWQKNPEWTRVQVLTRELQSQFIIPVFSVSRFHFKGVPGKRFWGDTLEQMTRGKFGTWGPSCRKPWRIFIPPSYFSYLWQWILALMTWQMLGFRTAQELYSSATLHEVLSRHLASLVGSLPKSVSSVPKIRIFVAITLRSSVSSARATTVWNNEQWAVAERQIIWQLILYHLF